MVAYICYLSTVVDLCDIFKNCDQAYWLFYLSGTQVLSQWINQMVISGIVVSGPAVPTQWMYAYVNGIISNRQANTCQSQRIISGWNILFKQHLVDTVATEKAVS